MAFAFFKVVQSGGKNIELAVMRRDQPLKVSESTFGWKGSDRGEPLPCVPSPKLQMRTNIDFLLYWWHFLIIP